MPTIAEAGLPGFRAVTWYAIVAPPDTPAAVADKISRDVAEVVNGPGDRRKHPQQAEDGSDRQHPRASDKLFADDAKLWAKVIQEANVSID